MRESEAEWGPRPRVATYETVLYHPLSTGAATVCSHFLAPVPKMGHMTTKVVSGACKADEVLTWKLRRCIGLIVCATGAGRRLKVRWE